MGESTALEALTAELLGDVGRLHDEVKGLSNALPGATDSVRQAGVDAAATIQGAVDQAVQGLAKGAAEAEAAKIQAEFVRVAEKTLADIRKQAHASAPAGWKIKVALSMSITLLVAAAAGGVVGYQVGAKRQPSADEVRQLAAGKDFLQVLPQLDQTTRDKLVRLIEKNHQQ